MKRTTALLLTLTAVIALSVISCDNDKEKIETMYSGFVTGYTDSEGYVTVIKDDFGTEYMVSEKADKLKPDTMYRVVASVALDEKKTARILQMVPTISYYAPEDSIVPDSLHVTDPVEINSLYIGGGYLNIHLGIKVQAEGTQHRLFYTHLDSSDKLKFTIYHNAYGDKPVYTKYAYMSIPLNGYGLAKNDTVFLSCKGYQEDYDYKLIFK
jgi:hypothetical protein